MPRSSTTRKKGDPALPGAGRKPFTPEMRSARELAAQHTVFAVQKLRDLAENAEEPAVQLRAADALLDRGHGRPAQSVELSGAGGAPIVFQVSWPPNNPDEDPAT